MTNEKEVLEQYAKIFPAGTVLFQEGDPGGEMFVIRKGKVQITRRINGKDCIITVIGEGNFFGEMSLLLNRPRSATATVVENTECLIFDQVTFLRMISTQSHITLRIMKNLAQRLYHANMQIEALMLSDKTHRVVKALHYLSREEGILQADGVLVPINLKRLSAFVGFPLGQVAAVVDQLAEARLVIPGSEGFLIAEEGCYLEFLEFLEMKEKGA